MTAATWKGAGVTVLCTIHYCTPPYLVVLFSQGHMTGSEQYWLDGTFLFFLVAVVENDSSEVNAFDGGDLEGSSCYSTLHHTLLYTTIPCCTFVPGAHGGIGAGLSRRRVPEPPSFGPPVGGR